MERAAFSFSRRKIVLGLAGTAVAAAVAVPALRPAAGERARRLLASNGLTRGFLSLADAGQGEWQAQVGSVFTVEGGYRMRLAGVQPLQSEGARPPQAWRERAFIAVFELAGGVTLAGDLIYTVAHPEYGALPLFLSASDDPRRMFAVFN